MWGKRNHEAVRPKGGGWEGPKTAAMVASGHHITASLIAKHKIRWLILAVNMTEFRITEKTSHRGVSILG